MHRSFFALILAVCVLAIPALADYKLEKGAAAPADLPAALKDAVEAQGIRILNDSGAPYIEIWFRKAIAAEAKPADGDVVYGGIPDGSFLGVWRFSEQGMDFRGQRIKPGLYSMRYSLMPVDGNHLGAFSNRDFSLLVPAAADQNPDAPLKFEEVVANSKKASGTNHPAVFPLTPAEGAGDATLQKDDAGHWVLKTKIPTKSGSPLPIAVIIYGRAEN